MSNKVILALIIILIARCVTAGYDCADPDVLCVDDSAGPNQEYSTIQPAANAAQPGDTVVVHAGTYNEQVGISRSGNPGNYINFVGYPGDPKPVVRGFGINGASYVRIIGFEITHNDNTKNGAIVGTGTTSYVEILDCYIHNVRGCSSGEGVVICDRGSATYWTLRGNTIYYVGYIPGVYDGFNNAVIGSNWPSPGTSHWLVEYNDISRSMDYFTLCGTYHIIRNNYVHDTNPNYWVNVGGGESGFHIDAFQQGSDGGQSFHRYDVYEANFISDFVDYYHCHGALEQDSGSFGDTDIIMRGNVFANMCGGALGGFSVDYVAVYQNTFYKMNQNNGNGPTIIMYPRGGDNPNYIVFMNNILSEDGSNNPMQLDDYPVSGTVSEYNLGYSSGSDSSYVSIGNPLFTNPSTQDLTLSSVSSPAYNTGRAIANIVSATGSGRSFNVAANAANRLTDGYGTVDGDTITVGSTTTRITDISGSTITIEDSVSWTNGDPVYWGRDSAPDIGALPYKSGGYALAASYSLSGNTVTVTPNDPSLVRFVVVYEDNVPVGADSVAPYSISGVGGGDLKVRVYPMYAGKTLFVEATGGPSTPECSDGIDNDGDRQVDYPNDSGCSSLVDNDESNCGDGVCEGSETQISCSADCSTSSCGPADTDSNGAVSNLELMAYIDGWQTGSVTLPNLMATIAEWKNGC